MKAKIGDVVIDKTYNKKGNLAIVVGEGISQPILIDHKGGITMDKLRDYFSSWDGLEVIGHIDFEKIWEEALRINDSSGSEKPNNSLDKDTNVRSKYDCKTCKHDLWHTPRMCGKCVRQEDGKPSMYEPKDEPQTGNGIGCLRCEFRFDCYDRDRPNAAHCNNYGKITDEPETERSE